MPTRVSINRFEGDDKSIAVLLTVGGDQINFPRSLLPKGAKPGEVLSLTIKVDATAAKAVAARTQKVQDDLSVASRQAATRPGRHQENPRRFFFVQWFRVGRSSVYELPIRIPVRNTRTPPMTTWKTADIKGVSM
jgi:hypothetical protein